MVDQSIVHLDEKYVVRWMRFRGRYPAREYVDSLDGLLEARFLALAKNFAKEGFLPDSHGKFLNGAYSKIYELKPGGHRIFGFLHEGNLYLTNGAPKKKKKEQESDYDRAQSMRSDFLDGLKHR